MSESSQNSPMSDSKADAIASIAVVLIVLVTALYWVSTR